MMQGGGINMTMKIMSLEHQKYEDVLENLAPDTKWKDPLFPPNNNSICPPNLWNEEKYNGFEWIRATKIPSLTDDEGELQVYVDEPTPNDIKQGALCDCYFLSSLSVIAERPDRIKNIINVTEVSEQGVYPVNLYKNGQKVQVLVDDFILCKNAAPVYSRANGNELWVLLAEKAWAKIHGSY